MFLDKAKQCPLITFEPGEAIIIQGSSTDFLYYMISGVCSRSIITNNGSEFVFEFRKASQDISSILGLTAPFADTDTFVCSFFAITECQCYKVPKQLILDHFDNDIEFLHQVIKMFTRETSSLYNKLMAHSEGMVGNYLCQLINNLSEIDDDGSLILPIKYTNEILSKMSGVTNVTVARVMSFLKKEGIIMRQKNRVLIKDEDKLHRYSDGPPLKYT